MINLDRAMDYLDFVAERHRVWERRQAGEPGPWTDDPILAARKFTNVFRILDPGTQFILTDLAEEGLPDRDLLARLFLYRHTGRIETWQHLEMITGYPTVDNLSEVLSCWQDYRGAAKITQRGQEARNRPGEKRVFTRSMFTGAYLVFPQSDTPGTDKLESIIQLTQRLFNPSSPDDVVPDFLAATTQAERFACLRRNKGVADFMSMQILTDWGYLADADQEDEFVVLGPGARKGAQAIDPTAKPETTFTWAVEAVRELPDCPELALDNIGEEYRQPSYMDVQNTLCEFSKYVRFQSKPGSPRPYSPAHPGPQDPPMLPRSW